MKTVIEKTFEFPAVLTKVSTKSDKSGRKKVLEFQSPELKALRDIDEELEREVDVVLTFVRRVGKVSEEAQEDAETGDGNLPAPAYEENGEFKQGVNGEYLCSQCLNPLQASPENDDVLICSDPECGTLHGAPAEPATEEESEYDGVLKNEYPCTAEVKGKPCTGKLAVDAESKTHLVCPDCGKRYANPEHPDYVEEETK